MIKETQFGNWNVYKEDHNITAIQKVTGTGAQQVISLGDVNSLINLFAKYPIFLQKIEIAFTDSDIKNVLVERKIINSTQKIVLLNQQNVTSPSFILDGEQKVDEFRLPFQLIFTITYTNPKDYEIVVMLEEI